MTTTTTIAGRLRELGKTAAAASAPVATYVSVARSGDLLFISGQISKTASEHVVGRVGVELSPAQGRHGAELAALNLLAQLAAATDGSLAAIRRVVRLGVFVAAAPDFAAHSQVANGASDLIVAVFGDAGRHARTAVGVTSLPAGSAVELDAVIELER